MGGKSVLKSKLKHISEEDEMYRKFEMTRPPSMDDLEEKSKLEASKLAEMSKLGTAAAV